MIQELNLLLKTFKEKTKKQESFADAINDLLKLHAEIFPKEVSDATVDTFEDFIWNNAKEEMFYQMPLKDDKTIAYYLYHLTRIEDITSNILIANTDQVFYRDCWQEKLNSPITTTGNELSREELVSFSKNINIKELKKYRIAVGKNTENIIKDFQFSDLKRKMNIDSLKRIISENSVSLNESAIWLIDYWGSKNVLGLILMPLTRHHIVHLNGCYRILDKLNKQKKTS